MKPQFLDLYSMSEDERIAQIGLAVLAGRTVAFVTDDEPGKAERYIEKLTARFPGLRVVSRHAGPLAGTVGVKVGPPPVHNN